MTAPANIPPDGARAFGATPDGARMAQHGAGARPGRWRGDGAAMARPAASAAAGAALAPTAPCPPVKPEGHGGEVWRGRRHPRGVNAPWTAPDGAAQGARNRGGAAPAHGAPDGAPADGAALAARLEEAGAALLALPPGGWSTRLASRRYDIVRSGAESYGWDRSARLRPPPPDARAIARMDEAYGWLALIPSDRYVLRRIVAARSLVHPLTGRHLHSWRRLGTLLGCDHKAVQRWHADGLRLILAGLGGRR